MFSFLKKQPKPEFDLTIHERYKHLLTQPEFAAIANDTLKYLGKLGKIKEFYDGRIVMNLNGEIATFSMDNLVRRCKTEDFINVSNIVKDHFDTLLDPGKDDYINSLIKDFNKAHDKLVVRVYPDNFISEDTLANVISKVDFPTTNTVLCLDVGEGYNILFKEDAEKWGISHETLFEIGLSNLSTADTTVNLLSNDDFEIYELRGSHAAALSLAPEKILTPSIGLYGSAIAIPTANNSFIMPLNNPAESTDLTIFKKLIRDIFMNEQSNITDDLFHYQDGKFEILKTVN
jgi:hypothetical protein